MQDRIIICHLAKESQETMEGPTPNMNPYLEEAIREYIEENKFVTTYMEGNLAVVGGTIYGAFFESELELVKE